MLTGMPSPWPKWMVARPGLSGRGLRQFAEPMEGQSREAIVATGAAYLGSLLCKSICPICSCCDFHWPPPLNTCCFPPLSTLLSRPLFRPSVSLPLCSPFTATYRARRLGAYSPARAHFFLLFAKINCLSSFKTHFSCSVIFANSPPFPFARLYRSGFIFIAHRFCSPFYYFLLSFFLFSNSL